MQNTPGNLQPHRCVLLPLGPPHPQVLSHTWLAEVECLMRAPAEAPGQNAAMRAASPEAPAPPAASPGFEARLDSAASDLACLGFSPATPCEQLAGPAWALLRWAQHV